MNEPDSMLRDGVRHAYSEVAERPGAEHPFPVGRAFAISVGYPPDVLDSLPSYVVESFAGVSNVAGFADIPAGATVLDLGCGAGLDTVIAAQSVGAEGRVIGIDFSGAMLAHAQRAARTLALENVTLVRADGERLPVRDGAVDVVLINGIFNLNPAREAIFQELGRVMRPGGTVFAAEIILRDPLTEDEQTQADWFA